MKSLPLFACLGLALLAPALHAQTNIRPDPNGKRLLYVDGRTIRAEPNGKPLIYIDEDSLRPDANGKRLLYVDQDGDVRPEPGGVRLALWDGTELRRSPNGKRFGLVDEHYFRPEPGFSKYFYIDGPPLTRMQLTAVLFLLKPEFFQIAPGEKAAKEKEMAANDAEEQKRLAADFFPGDHAILSHHSAKGPVRKGSIVIAKQGPYYALTYKTDDGAAWQGIGVKVTTKGGDIELWAGVAPAGAVSLGVYEIKGGALNGTWVPINMGAANTVLGFENLVGAPELGGVYQIISGKLPNGGVAYTGALNIDPLPETLNAESKCYRVRWATGTTGLAFRSGDRLAVAAGWGADVEILCLRQGNADLQGEFLGQTCGKGFYSILK